MSGLALRGPQKPGAGEFDEGRLTEFVVGQYAREDGAHGQEAAELVLPARIELWMQCEYTMPRRLAEVLRSRCDPADQTGKYGVRELRMETVAWLDPLPLCSSCLKPIPDGPNNLCTGVHKNPRKCRASRKKFKLEPPQWESGWKAAREACKVKGKTIPGHYSVVADRDADALLTATNLSFPDLPPSVRAARVHFDRVLSDALKANGRLILKSQLQRYSPDGASSRADLVQGGALGCRRALIDYDKSQARFSTYAIKWIHQGLGKIFHKRDLVAIPRHVVSTRRQVEVAGLDPNSLYSAMFAVANARGCGPLESLQLYKDLLKITAPLHIGQDPEVVLSSLVALVVGGTHRQKVEKTLEKISTWVAKWMDKARTGPKPKRGTTGSRLLSSLRYGSPRVLSVSMEKPEDDEEDQTPSLLVDEDLDMDRAMELAEDERVEAIKQAKFQEALALVRSEDPEAAEVLRRHHGLESFEEESLEDIAKGPLLSSGRHLCRESLRLLEVRGKTRLMAHMACMEVKAPPPTKKVRRPPHLSRSIRPSPSAIPWSAPTEVQRPAPEFEAWSAVRDEVASIPW